MLSERGFLAKGLDISFSRVKYHQIAPLVGLEPSRHLQDALTLEMHHAHIPNVLFKAIIEDIEIGMKQYGPPTITRMKRRGPDFWLWQVFRDCPTIVTSELVFVAPQLNHCFV